MTFLQYYFVVVYVVHFGQKNRIKIGVNRKFVYLKSITLSHFYTKVTFVFLIY